MPSLINDCSGQGAPLSHPSCADLLQGMMHRLVITLKALGLAGLFRSKAALELQGTCTGVEANRHRNTWSFGG